MRTAELEIEGYRPCFSGHETFPLRHGWLQKAFRAVSDAPSPKDASGIFRDPAAITRFGVGRNMVAAIKFWSIAAGVLDETSEGLVTGWAGELLLGENGIDLYLEDPSSIWLLHWFCASRPRLTSVYWLFNEYNGSDLLRKDALDTIMAIAAREDWSRVARTTVDRDLQCHLRNYIGGRGQGETGGSLFSELGLIIPLDRHRVRLVRAAHGSLPSWVFLFALEEFWDRTAPTAETLSFERIAYTSGSPGRVFLLEPEALVDRLEGLDRVSHGNIAWSESAGLRQLVRRRSVGREERYAWLADMLRGRLKDEPGAQTA
ncbi:DUF4007 family protein [Erythrobacter crassostreae]|uniref:DUF4007 family protein n=1 Tax=Erythrobacter crassostreae TaxID=2828328 RepID=A0A9X1F395_9SPHN|nr:DUF4007 family protein [Erythrobacter crassostrea]MBV7259364.1 DUF4007 family protein [Erythrobacter crassostrea]